MRKYSITPKSEEELEQELLHNAVLNCIEIDTQYKNKY